MVSLTDLPGAYLASCPDWTLNCATLTARDGSLARIEEQTPFHWEQLAWQTEISIRLGAEREGQPEDLRLTVRITPDTLRRWKQVSIDPLIEACAQLQDHCRSARTGAVSTLTLL